MSDRIGGSLIIIGAIVGFTAALILETRASRRAARVAQAEQQIEARDFAMWGLELGPGMPVIDVEEERPW